MENSVLNPENKENNNMSIFTELRKHAIVRLILIGAILYSAFALLGDPRAPLPIISNISQQANGFLVLLVSFLLYQKIYE